MRYFSNIFLGLSIAMVLFICSCNDDEKLVQEPIPEDNLSIARSILKDSIVLNAKAMMGTVDKTLLPNGCPMKYYLEWRSEDTLNIQIRNFSVGKMPLNIWFSINVKFMQLNTWEKEEYTGDGWFKFKGKEGITNYTGRTEDYADGSGGDGNVIGYFNVFTNEIEFNTEFNVMLVQSFVFQQVVDHSRMADYEEELRQFAEDLEKYKEEHGI